MSLTMHRQARVNVQHRMSLPHAGFRPGTRGNVMAIAPRVPADGKHAADHGAVREL